MILVAEVKGAIGRVGVGFCDREILLDLGVARRFGAQLENRVDFAGSVRGNVDAFAAGSLAAGIFHTALYAIHVGEKGFGGGGEIADHMSTLSEDVDGHFA